MLRSCPTHTSTYNNTNKSIISYKHPTHLFLIKDLIRIRNRRKVQSWTGWHGNGCCWMSVRVIFINIWITKLSRCCGYCILYSHQTNGGYAGGSSNDGTHITRIGTRTSVTYSNCKRGENLCQNTNADHNSIAVARCQTVTRQLPSSSPPIFYRSVMKRHTRIKFNF